MFNPFDHSAKQTMFFFQMLLESLADGVHVLCNGRLAFWCLIFVAIDVGAVHIEDISMSLPGFIVGLEALLHDFTLAWNVLVAFCKIS